MDWQQVLYDRVEAVRLPDEHYRKADEDAHADRQQANDDSLFDFHVPEEKGEARKVKACVFTIRIPVALSA